MFSSTKIDLQRDFAACVNLSEAQNPIPPHIHTGKGEGGGDEVNHRDGESGNSS
jgi:hypothetical protein